MSSPERASTLRRLAERLPGLTGTNRSTWEPLVRGSAAVLGITVIAQLLAFSLHILFARLLGPAEFGIYSFVFAGLGLCLILAKFGLDTTLIRLVAEFNAQGDSGRLLGLVRFARTTGPILGIIVALCVLLLTPNTAAAESPSLYHALIVGALFLPLGVYSELTAAALRGLQRVVLALAGDGIVRPCVAGVGLLGVASLWPGALTGASALLVYLAGTVASLTVTSIMLRRVLPKGSAVADATDIWRYLRIATSLMLASGFLVAMYSLDTVMLGILADTTTAGFYSVASRIAIFVLFVTSAAQIVAAPMLATAKGSRQPSELRGIVRTLNSLAVLAALPCSLLLLFAAEPIMGMFGYEFREAAPALRILVLAQLLNVFTGPTGMVLSMTGHERTLVRLLFAGLAINVLLNLLWIPAYGLVGAAASAFVAHAAWNIAGVFLIRSRLAIDVTPLDLLRQTDLRSA